MIPGSPIIYALTTTGSIEKTASILCLDEETMGQITGQMGW